MRFSIIIPTYNEERDIAATLEALLGLDYPDREIVVVDDSSDRTPEIVGGYARQGVRLIHPGGGGRCEARNLGIREASGEVVVLLNADVRLPADFLRRLAYHYQNGADYVLVDAKVANRQFLFPRYVHCVSEVFYGRAVDCNFANMDWTEGFSCRRETALKAGLFPTGFPVPICAGEDGFFGRGLRRIGAKKVIDLSLEVAHVVPASFQEYWRNRQGRGAGSAQVHRFLDCWPWWKILLWNGLKTVKTLVWLTTVAPALWICLQAVRHSDRGLKDLGPFFYAYAVEQLAALQGEWQATFAIMKLFVRERRGSALR
jgi:glycosyltransferase involved in cell wall biosynthesis